MFVVGLSSSESYSIANPISHLPFIMFPNKFGLNVSPGLALLPATALRTNGAHVSAATYEPGGRIVSLHTV